MKKRLCHVAFVTVMVCFSAVCAWGSDAEDKNTGQAPGPHVAAADIYIDLATMHRYVKNPDGTYREYNRRGEFFQVVSPNLPLLTQRCHVIPVDSHCYLLYVKKQMSAQNDPVTIKPAMAPHPEGWLLKKALVDVRYTSH